MGLKQITVFIPVYDGSPIEYLRQCLDSMEAQTIRDNIEVFIFRNGITNTLLNEELDKRIWDNQNLYRYFESDINVGIPKAYNKMLPHAQGEYIASQDADDFSNPRRFEEQLKFMEQKKVKIGKTYISMNGFGMIGCNTLVIDEKGSVVQVVNTLKYTTPYWQICESNLTFGGSSFSKKEAILNVGGYDENYPYCWDYNLWVRMHINGWKTGNVQKGLYYHRLWGGQASALYKKAQKEQHNNVVKLINQHNNTKKGNLCINQK